MKINRQYTMAVKFYINFIFVFFLITFFLNCPAIAAENKSQPGNNTRDSIIVKAFAAKKNQEITLHTNASNEALFFTSTCLNGKVYKLFLFDMDGKLTICMQVRNKEITTLAQLPKGNYLFEIFSNDERIENGNIIVR